MKKTAIFAALCAVLLAAGCGKSGPQLPGEAERGPLAARVNGTDIYQGQISNVLSRFGNLPPERAKDAGKQVLEKIIEENLLLQQAQGKNLDKDPKVIQAIAAARNDILIKAYLEQLASSTAKPTDAEIQSFFDANPALFKERRVYNLREMSVAAKLDILPKIQAAAAQAKSLEDMGAWLRNEKIPFSVSTATKAAEQLPLELVPRFAAMKDGEVVIIPTPNAILVEQLMGSQVQPVELAAAKTAIERLLLSRKQGEATANELKQQRGKAKIEYFGDYAQAAGPAAVPAEKK